MKLRNCAIYLVSFMLLCVSSGCASFREGNVPRARSSPQSPRGKQQSISVSVQGAVILDGNIYQANRETTDNWRSQTIKAYRDSGLFSEVKGDADEADLYAEVVIVDKGDPNALLAFITGLTLYIVPSKATDEFTVKAAIRDKDGKILGRFEKSETVILWQQLFMVFAMPSNWPESVAKEALYDLNRAIIRDAYFQGFF